MHLMALRTKIILLAVAVITALATIFAATYQPRRTETIARPLIKINAYLPLSGPNARVGLAAKNAMQQIINDSAAKVRYKYDILFKDSNTDTTQDKNSAKADIRVEFAPEPRATLAINAETPEKFIIHSPYKQISDLFVKDLSRRSFKNIGFITAAQGDYRSLAQTFKNALPDTYGLAGAVIHPGQNDFGTLINLLRNNDTDLFLLVGAPSEIDVLTEQLHDNGISNFNISTLYTVDVTDNPKLYDNTRSAGSVAGAYDVELAGTALKTLIGAYEKNFKKDLLPAPKTISGYISKNNAKDGIIAVPSAIKAVRDGQITSIKE